MQFSKFEQVITKLKFLQGEQDAYANKLPPDIRSCVTDNEYLNLTRLSLDVVCTALFEHLTEDALCCLYEPFPQQFTVNGIEYVLENVDDYLKYAKETMVWDPE